jgi:anti-anti-sigma factor
MNPFEIETTSDQTRLRVSGEISVQNARECLEMLLEFQHGGNRLLLDLHCITCADVSFLRLIYSLHRTCLKAGQDLILIEHMSEAFKTILESSGNRRPGACRTPGGENPCLWSWRDEK